MTLTREQQYFRQALQALEVAAPLWLALGWEDGFAHCIEVSANGAAALNATKEIKARAIPCGLIGQNSRQDTSVILGLSPREHYDLISRNQQLPNFEDWKAQNQYTDTRWNAHVIIEAEYHGERALIDPSLGQLRHSQGIPVPLAIHDIGQGWLGFDLDDWRFRYVAASGPKGLEKMLDEQETFERAQSMTFLMNKAVRCGLDRDRLAALLKTTMFNWVEPVQRLIRFSNLPA